MPAWGGDLSTDEIDALAGFILSPQGSALYSQQCGDCHELTLLASGNPLELRNALDLGSAYPAHQGVDVPDWDETLTTAQGNALLNFLAAPDGQRLFTINCAGCHGRGVTFAGDEEGLRQLIREGGQHLEMPAWRGTLSEADLDTLAAYVADPAAAPGGATLFGQHCSTCHAEIVPSAPDKQSARRIIAGGGAHVTMPVWGEVLTAEQLDALVAYTLAASKGTGVGLGAQLFADNCSSCHGSFGEGGPNPARPGDTIAPISSAEYLRTRDDITLRAIIAQGQPNFGMSPFGEAAGGSLSTDEIDAIVNFMRGWEANPPVELPPEVSLAPESALTGTEIFVDICARCHGPAGEGGLGPALRDPEVQARYDDQGLFDTISQGHEATAMIGWGEVLTDAQIQQLVQHIRTLAPADADPTAGAEPTEAASSAEPTFAEDVLPLLQAKCAACHNPQTHLGGWDASSYETAINSGDNGPAVVPSDAASSLLAHKIQGTQTQGGVMPPAGLMPQEEIQLILDWIEAGAPVS
jgi:mono/diheme cytochrome c family protein